MVLQGCGGRGLSSEDLRRRTWLHCKERVGYMASHVFASQTISRKTTKNTSFQDSSPPCSSPSLCSPASSSHSVFFPLLFSHDRTKHDRLPCLASPPCTTTSNKKQVLGALRQQATAGTCSPCLTRGRREFTK